jgi:hypothetical protein
MCTGLSWLTVRSCCKDKDQIQILSAHRQKGMSRLRGSYRKALVEPREVRLAQELVGRSHASEAMNPQFLR